MFRDNLRNGFGLGLTVGICLTLILCLWASVPGPTDRPGEAPSERQADPSGGWELEGAISTSEDTLAQWVMAAFGVIATGLSAAALVLLKETLFQTAAATAAAQTAVGETRRIGEAQVRAYLSEVNVSVEGFRPGQRPIYRVTLKNTGQSPARNVKIYVGVRQEIQNAERIKFRKIRFLNHTDVPAGQSAPQEFQTEAPLNDPVYQGVLSGQVNTVMGGVFAYRDVFGKRHLTVFRYQLDPDFLDSQGEHKLRVSSRNNCAS